LGISGGGDRRELRPLRRDGSLDHDLAGHTTVGNHKGVYAAFNIVDPRPGTVHQWTTRREFLGCKQRGWWKADPEVDGRAAYELMQEYTSETGTKVDSTDSAYSEYIHVVTSEENYRRLTEEHLQANKDQLGPAGLGFLENIPENEFEQSRSASGRHLPTRWATREHGTYVVQGNETLEHLTPNGILREEDI
jgi:hypothetical protein